MEKSSNYEEIKERFIAHLVEKIYFSIDEALDTFRDVRNDKATAERLHNDPDVLWEYRANIIAIKAEQRGSLVSAGRSGNEKAAKTALSILADDREWAKLSGKSFGELGLIGGGGADRVEIVQKKVAKLKEVPTDDLMKELKKRERDARLLLAETTAESVSQEDEDDGDTDDKIEFTEK